MSEYDLPEGLVSAHPSSVGRTLAIGDIHGCYNALDVVLEAADVAENDRVVTLGDYVDRGPQSADVIQRVREGVASGRWVALRGNHEEMFLSARESKREFAGWAWCGGDATIESYDLWSWQPGLPQVPVEDWAFLEATRSYYETEGHIFVHASLDAKYPMDQQQTSRLLWGSFEAIEPHISGKTVICGHTSQSSGRPCCRGHAVCIDTSVAGWITCLDVESGRYWQGNEAFEARAGQL